MSEVPVVPGGWSVSVQCCKQPRALVKGVLVCEICDALDRVPNKALAEAVPAGMKQWKLDA